MIQKVFFIFVIATVAVSCSSNRYSATNRSYKKQAKAFGKIIRSRLLTMFITPDRVGLVLRILVLENPIL